MSVFLTLCYRPNRLPHNRSISQTTPSTTKPSSKKKKSKKKQLSQQDSQLPLLTVLIQNDAFYSDEITDMKLSSRFQRLELPNAASTSSSKPDTSSNSKKKKETQSKGKPSKDPTGSNASKSKKPPVNVASVFNGAPKEVPSNCSLQEIANGFILGINPDHGRLCIFFPRRNRNLMDSIQQKLEGFHQDLDSRMGIHAQDEADDASSTSSSKTKGKKKGKTKKKSSRRSKSSASLLSNMKRINALREFSLLYLDSFLSPEKFLQKYHKVMQRQVPTLSRSSSSAKLRKSKAAAVSIPAFNCLLFDSVHGLYYYSNTEMPPSLDPYKMGASPTPTSLVTYRLMEGDYCVDDMSQCFENNYKQAHLPKMRKIMPRFLHLLHQMDSKRNTLSSLNDRQREDEKTFSKLLNLLSDEDTFPVSELPADTGLDIDWEQIMSSIQVRRNFVFGTRASTLLVLDADTEKMADSVVSPDESAQQDAHRDSTVPPKESSSLNLIESSLLGQALKRQRNDFLLKRFEQEKQENGEDCLPSMDPFVKRCNLQLLLLQNRYNLNDEVTHHLRENNSSFSPVIPLQSAVSNPQIPLNTERYCHSMEFCGPPTKLDPPTDDNEANETSSSSSKQSKMRNLQEISLIERMKGMQIELELVAERKSKGKKRKK